ncbi:MAG: carboxypeptidase regulatory-like domain-containing protein [Deltaproteobacteria bacterium]|nr:carboxypeptidase regulatory-like domain-containing protein [Deltaproteobacteria bacterium]
MKSKTSAIYRIVLPAAGLASVGVFLFLFNQRPSWIEGRIIDTLSKDAVWHVTIRVGGKSTTKFASTSYRLTGIKKGSYTLRATAPNYYDFVKPVKIKRGKNVIDIAMRGREIPDLQGIIVFTEATDKGLEIEIRLTDSKRMAIMNPPALPFTLEGTLYVRKGEEGECSRGRKLFQGPIDLFWEPHDPLAKNKGIIPWDRITVNPEREKSGVLEVVLHTPQGDFRYTTDRVELVRQVSQNER